MNSSKLSTLRSFSMSIMWYIFAVLTFVTLFQNHLEWIFPAFFNCLHLYANWWFSWHMLSEMKSLPANFSWLRFSDLLRRFFLSIRMFRLFPGFEFYNHNLLFFLRRWQAWRSTGITSWPVRERERALCKLYLPVPHY